MKFLNEEILKSEQDAVFRTKKPYPWTICKNIFNEDGLKALRFHMPDISLYTYENGWVREGGQKPHVRHGLIYEKGMQVPEAWHSFIKELEGNEYRNFIKRMFGINDFDLMFYWQLTSAGCSVSPHCDSVKKFGSHIFYLNSEGEWDTAWGGETLILDDSLQYKAESNPEFEDLKIVASSPSAPNSSLLFARTDHSWHGVKELMCPKGVTRKLFTVIINKKKPSLVKRILRKIKLSA
jgi:hypothetical protein